MEQRNTGIDVARVFAVSLVVLYHALSSQPTWVGVMGGAGWMGVDLFFVMSGMLVTMGLEELLARDPASAVKTYLRKRAVRLLPAYLASVGIALSIAVAIPPLRKHVLLNAGSLLTFTANHCPNLLPGPLWSLAVEVQFYMMLPCLVLRARLPERIRVRPVLWSVVLLSIPLIARTAAYGLFPSIESFVPQNLVALNLAGKFPVQTYGQVYGDLFTHADGLLFGLWLGAMAHSGNSWMRARGKRGMELLCAVGAFVLVYNHLAPWRTWMPRPWYLGVFGFTMVTLVSSALLVSLVQHEGFQARGKTDQMLRWVSNRIYSLYLAQAVLEVMFVVIPRWRLTPGVALVVGLIYLVLVLVVGSLLYRTVEEPFLRRKSGLRSVRPIGGSVSFSAPEQA